MSVRGEARPRRRRLGLRVAMCVATFTAGSWVGVALPADAQVRMRNSDSQLLRESAALESQGDYAGAETVLRALLERNPSSSGGLFALERVLRASGDIVSILPAVDGFLEEQPRSSGVRSLKLRVLSDVDSIDAVRREAEVWLESDASNVVPYREVARVYQGAFGPDEAIDVLERGRAVLGEPDALALEMGDVLAATGNVTGAATEWARAVGRDAAQVTTVTRRIEGLGEDADLAGRHVVETLGEADEVGRRRAGARLALDLGYDDVALELTQDVADDLSGRPLSTFLTDVARRARERGMSDVAAWAYDELGEGARSPTERRQFDQRIIDVALAAGDTVAALEAQRRVAESFTPGSVDRRRATAQVIRLEGARSEPDELREMLDGFRAEYPNAPELDDLAAAVAGALQRRGDPAGAAGVLDGIEGPRSSLERAYLLLDVGEVDEGRGALLLALTGLPPSEATPVIQFAGLLGRVSEPAKVALAEAGVAAHRGEGGAAAELLVRRAPLFDAAEQPALLAEAARMAVRAGDDAAAAEIHSRIVADHPDASEVGEATLALARYHARTAQGTAEAIRLLEDLIGSRPNAAVVPDARVELERLRQRG
ncbi:MAG: hypothetical protein AAF389_12640 [Gemmatimonadota bacterium]